MKKTPALVAGVFLLFIDTFVLPEAQAAVPNPVISITASASKITGSAWSNDGSLGGSVNLYPSTVTTPTFTSADTSVALNMSGQQGHYVAGSVGSQTLGAETTLEITMKLPSSQAYGASSGVIFMWEGTNYTIWFQGNNCIGFNTGHSEIYGFNPSSLLGTFHTYTFVMSTYGDDSTKQKAYVDGTLQSLTYCIPGYTAVQADKSLASATKAFDIGIFRDHAGFPTSMNLRRFKLWLSDIGAAAIQESYNSYLAPTSNVLTLTSGLKTATYRTTSTLRSTVDVDGAVTFFSNGKKISGCINVATLSKVADCAWKPSVIGSMNLTAQLKTSNGNLSSTTFPVSVTKRSVLR